MSAFLDSLRETRFWSRLRDLRHLRYRREQRRFLSAFIRKGGLVFDVGANVGHYTLVATSLGARVVAVEPQAVLADRLRRRFRGSAAVTVVQCAVGAGPGTASLHKTADLTEVASLRPDAGKRSRFAMTHPFSLSETVEVVTLESLIERHGRPDFCKIDVEGHEGAVLEGLKIPIAALSIEFNREYEEDTARCINALAALGPYRFNYALAEETRLAEAEWLDALQIQGSLRRHSDPRLWGDLYARLDP
ncbi:MAG TPA: FkbM family methyltransferase [Opitutaceae bacterium]|jgi:FkbM family methyltransferase